MRTVRFACDKGVIGLSELWNEGSELEYFSRLWSQRSAGPVNHSSEIWDARAKRWIDNLDTEPGKSARSARIAATAEYLRAHGLLNAEDTVVDVGCGPGLFVLEFAKTVRHAVGIDYSRCFVEYARGLAAAAGVENAEFQQRDFLALDVQAEQLTRQYDLVFSSLTPAATGDGCLEKLMSMSRGWCCNATIVHAGDSLAERVMREVFGEELRTRWDGRGFYTLLNLLWLQGYYPETSYYDDVRDETVVPDRRWAKKIAAYCGKRAQEDVDRIEAYLLNLGEVPRHSTSRYGMILWNVERKDRR